MNRRFKKKKKIYLCLFLDRQTVHWNVCSMHFGFLVLFVIFDSELVSGPLSSTHLSNKLTDRSRLRVAYQVFDIKKCIYTCICVCSCVHMTVFD